MGVTYTQGSDVAALDPKRLSEQLSAVVSDGMVWLKKVFPTQTPAFRSAKGSGARSR